MFILPVTFCKFESASLWGLIIVLNVELENYFSDLKNNINQNIINGYSLSEISTEYDLEVKLLNNEENINNSNNEKSIEKAIIKEGYILNKDFVSNLIDFNKDISFVLNVDKINKSEPIEYDKIYKTVINDWISNKKNEYINNNYNENANNFDYLNKLSSEYSIMQHWPVLNGSVLLLPEHDNSPNINNKIV